MSGKFGLGRGMMALLDENELESEESSKITTKVEIEKVLPNRYQPRKRFDEAALMELADSIREKGVIQPIIVTDLGDGRYELVVGERRLRASKLAGMNEIPVIIKDFSEADRLEIALIENIQRQDLNPIEEALAYKEIMEKLNIGQEEVAKRVGKNRSSVTNTLRLLKLPESIRERIIVGELTEGHARAILSLNDMDKMISFANFIVENGLSVREAENASKEFALDKQPDVSRETQPKRENPFHDLQERFIQSIGARVEIKGSHKKGRIEIHYNSKEELENIYRSIAGKNTHE